MTKDDLEIEIEKEKSEWKSPVHPNEFTPTETLKTVKSIYGEKKAQVQKARQEHPDLDYKQLRKQWSNFYPDIPKPSMTTVWKAFKEPLEQTTETATETVKESVVVATEPTEAEITKAETEAQKPLAEVAQSIMSGKITKDQIKAIFVIENKMLIVILGDDAQHDKDTMDLLSGIWETPLNRFMAKYLDKNIDIFIAIGLTLYAHLPIILKMWKKSKEKKKVVLP